MTIHFRFLGIWFSTASGNCFAPALQSNHYGLTVRTLHWRKVWSREYSRDQTLRETNISRRADGSFWWNSDHIACWLGTHYPGNEEKGYPDIWEYKGILGHHQYVA